MGEDALGAALGTLAVGEDGVARGEIPASWAQGRASFGGLVLAVALRAMRARVPADRETRSLLCAFVGPLSPGAVAVDVRELRAGRAATHVHAIVRQGDAVAASVSGVFGSARPSGVVKGSALASPPPAREGLIPLRYLEGVTPRFTRHFEYAFTPRSLPFQGGGEGGLEGWCRLPEARGVAADELVAALVDAWPTAVLPMLKTPAPASSLTWAIDFVPHAPASSPDAWWWYASTLDAARDGYAQADARLYTAEGELAALSRQSMVVFDG